MTKLLDLLSWLKANRQRVILYAAIIIVVAVGLTWFVNERAQRQVRASEALSNVKTAGNTQAPVPGEADAYLKVANDYPGTKAAAMALLKAGGLLYTEANYDKSYQAFQRVLKEYPETEWRAEATLGLAKNLEALGKPQEALAKYEEVRKNPTAAVADEAKLDVARLYEKENRQVEALKIYDEMVKANPYSGLGSEAGVRLEELTNRFPALATNLAPIMPPVPQLVFTNPPASNRVITVTNLATKAVTNAAPTNLAPAPKAPAPTPPAPAPSTNKVK